MQGARVRSLVEELRYCMSRSMDQKKKKKRERVELLYDPATLLLGIYPKNMKILTQKDICTRMFIAALFTIAKTWKQPASVH